MKQTKASPMKPQTAEDLYKDVADSLMTALSLKEIVVTTHKWNPSTGQVQEVTTVLDTIIRNPSGFKVETIGSILFNLERRKRGLTEYRKNLDTGTYDEVVE